MWRVFVLLVLTGCSASASGELTGSPSTRSDRDVIRIPLTLYVVADQGATEPSISSRRSTGDLTVIADAIAPIWAQADIAFDPLVVRNLSMPTDVVQELVVTGGFDRFFAQAGRTFDVADPGVINGFYVREAFAYNGFTPEGSLVFFVADEPTVRDQRVSSHEIGHILGLGHALDDPNRLMFSGTNGMILTAAEQERARTTALEILDDAQ